MLTLTVVTILLAVAGVALAVYVVRTHTRPPATDSSPWRWTPMELLIQAVALGWVLLCVAVGIRHYKTRGERR